MVNPPPRLFSLLWCAYVAMLIERAQTSPCSPLKQGDFHCLLFVTLSLTSRAGTEMSLRRTLHVQLHTCACEVWINLHGSVLRDEVLSSPTAGTTPCRSTIDPTVSATVGNGVVLIQYQTMLSCSAMSIPAGQCQHDKNDPALYCVLPGQSTKDC